MRVLKLHRIDIVKLMPLRNDLYLSEYGLHAHPETPIGYNYWLASNDEWNRLKRNNFVFNGYEFRRNKWSHTSIQ